MVKGNLRISFSEFFKKSQFFFSQTQNPFFEKSNLTNCKIENILVEREVLFPKRKMDENEISERDKSENTSNEPEKKKEKIADLSDDLKLDGKKKKKKKSLKSVIRKVCKEQKKDNEGTNQVRRLPDRFPTNFYFLLSIFLIFSILSFFFNGQKSPRNDILDKTSLMI